MPVIHREGPYKFQFFAVDRDEPPHIHTRRDDNVAKFWLSPVELQNAGGFRSVEIRRIRRLVEQNRAAFLEAWHGYFDR